MDATKVTTGCTQLISTQAQVGWCHSTKYGSSLSTCIEPNFQFTCFPSIHPFFFLSYTDTPCWEYHHSILLSLSLSLPKPISYSSCPCFPRVSVHTRSSCVLRFRLLGYEAGNISTPLPKASRVLQSAPRSIPFFLFPSSFLCWKPWTVCLRSLQHHRPSIHLLKTRKSQRKKKHHSVFFSADRSGCLKDRPLRPCYHSRHKFPPRSSCLSWHLNPPGVAPFVILRNGIVVRDTRRHRTSESFTVAVDCFF